MVSKGATWDAQSSDDVEPFGETLRRLRHRAGLTQEQLAARAGLSVNAVSALERGTRTRPYARTREALGRALGLSEGEQTELSAGVADSSGQALPPVVPSPTIGRSAYIDEVLGLLIDHRLVTLTGPGGVGKTRVALEVARRAGTAYPNGCVYVSLGTLDKPEDVLPAVAQSLGLRELGHRAPPEVLTTYLRTRRMLLVLDNMEHLLPAAAEIAALLDSSAGLAVLATSRAALRIAMEHVHPVPPLARSAANQLFRERAAQATGAPLVADSEAINQVCARLDYLPLAIELVAARTRLLSATQLSSMLDSVLTEFDAGPRDAPARQRTLRHTVDWSYQLLDPEARTLLPRLSVFRGGWTLEAATALCDLTVDNTQALLLNLLDYNLITRKLVWDEPRFDMLETIRAYAAERLDAGEHSRTSSERTTETTGERHAMYFARWATESGAQLWRADQAKVLRALDTEYENVRAAMNWLSHRGQIDQLAESCYALWLFWITRGHLHDPQGWADATLGTAQPQPATTTARLHYVAGWSRLARGYFDEAAERFAQAVRLAERAGEEVLHCWAVACLANVELCRGALDTATRLADEAMTLSRQHDQPHVETCCAVIVGMAAFACGQLEAADAMLTQGRAAFEARGAEWPLACALTVHGRIALELGKYNQAQELLTRSVELLDRLGCSFGMANLITDAADAAVLRGDLEHAALLYGAVAAMSTQTGLMSFPSWRKLRDRCRSDVLRGLGVDRYNELRARGERLSRDEVVALASGTAPR